MNWKKGYSYLFRFFIWVIKRNFLIYVIIFLSARLVIDFDRVERKVKAKQLNELMPAFDYLIDFEEQKLAPDKKKFEEFAAYYERVDELMPDHSEINGLLGYSYYYLGEQAKAIERYEKAIQLNPRYFWFYFNLATIHFKSGHYEKTVELLSRAIEEHPVLTLKLTVSSKEHKRIILGIKNVEKALTQRTERGYTKAYVLLIAAHYQMGHYKDVVELAAQALHRKIDETTLFYSYIGLASVHLGEYSEAKKVLKEMISADPENAQNYRDILKVIEKEIKEKRGKRGLSDAKALADLQERIEEVGHQIALQIF